MGSKTWQSCRASTRPLLRQCRVHAVQKDTEISTKDWRAQRMADKVHALFDRVWSKGEVQLVDDLITDDFVWKVGTQRTAASNSTTGQRAGCRRPYFLLQHALAHFPRVKATDITAICLNPGKVKHMATGLGPAAVTCCSWYSGRFEILLPYLRTTPVIRVDHYHTPIGLPPWCCMSRPCRM
jgi:hypothetical protein